MPNRAMDSQGAIQSLTWAKTRVTIMWKKYLVPLASSYNKIGFPYLHYIKSTLQWHCSTKLFLGEPHSYVLNLVHTLFGILCCLILGRRGAFLLTQLSDRENVTLFVFSLLYTISILIWNISLKLETAPFHKVIRVTTSLFPSGFNVVLYRTSYPLLA